jgi:hypothetical protein
MHRASRPRQCSGGDHTQLIRRAQHLALRGLA